MINYSVMNYVFGPPGSGKTCFLSYLSRKYLKAGFKVYTNFPLKDCIQIQDDMLGYYSFSDSVLLLDELGISMSNRDFKNGLMSDKQRLRYFKLIRHYLQKSKNGCCWVCSQGWDDIDKKVRDLCTSYWLLKKWFSLTILKPVVKTCSIDPMTHEPADYFEFDPLWSWRFIYRPLYYKYFDSFDAPTLPELPDPEGWTWNIKKKKEGDNLESFKNSEGVSSSDGGTATAPM